MRQDRQHKEYRPHLLGLPVYYGSTAEGSAYWQDMLMAFALVMREHDPELMKQRVGASTGAILLTRLALKWLPEPYNRETQHHYIILCQKRAALDAIDEAAAETIAAADNAP